MLLGHLLVMLVHAPTTDQLPLLQSGKKKREDTFGRATEKQEQFKQSKTTY